MSDTILTSEKLHIISEFIRESPPGQLNDVFHDCQTLIGDEELMKTKTINALREYTNEQLLTCPVPNTSHHVVLCPEGELQDGVYIDPRSHSKFSFNYLTQSASDFQQLGSGELGHSSSVEEWRAALQSSLDEYVSHHYPSGVSSVFVINQSSFVLCIIDNKYSPSNFWSGRWRSRWVYEKDSSEIKGSLKVQVHYYEDGNVQLFNQKDITIKITPPKSPSELASLFPKVLTKSEHEFQLALNEAYNSLSDNIFKSLRRALPVTKTKFNWDQVAGYRLGSNLAKSS